MSRFKSLFIIFIATAIFITTVAILSVMGYEVERDSTFETRCKEVGGVYFLSKSNEEYCARSDFLIHP